MAKRHEYTLRELRQKKAEKLNRPLHHQEVADATGCSRAHLVNMERGRKTPSLDLSRRLALYFGVSSDSILYGVRYDQENTQMVGKLEPTAQMAINLSNGRQKILLHQ